MTRDGRSEDVGDRSLHNVVYAAIVDRIHRGELEPGDRLNEADIADRLGISRGPVRDAISRLAHEGLVVRKPRSGSFVAKLSTKDLEEIHDARQLLEGYAARHACLRMTPEDAAELRGLIAAMAEAARNEHWTEGASLNARFHQTVVRSAKNTILLRFWTVLDPLAWLLAPAVTPYKVAEPEDLVTRHQALLDALLSGDPDAAEEAFRRHIAATGQTTIRRHDDRSHGQPQTDAETLGSPRS